MIGSQQRSPGSQHACTLPDCATARAALPYFLLDLFLNAGSSIPCSHLLVYVKANYSPAGHICQGVYNGTVSHSPKHYDLALLFAALADRTRLRLLNLMDGREVCVCYFVEILGQSQPKISRHLAYLRRAGVVAARREGKWMHYSIVAPADSGAAGILRETLSALRDDRGMKTDLSRLNKACCTPQKVLALNGVPQPIPLEASVRVQSLLPLSSI